ncbi:hypothetical protein BpHYR1_048485 [Brachionus plicatilis]|uniref:Uncharacterized protein n=1 Tax=Brachionus plicatilis TaxID=10195 RepID=A0A3M7QU21_BRAPC|nr:hypothetical protein BpHYR1_048485 [Brachionus plicatilis]
MNKPATKKRKSHTAIDKKDISGINRDLIGQLMIARELSYRDEFNLRSLIVNQESFIRSSVYQAYKTMEVKPIFWDKFLTKAIVYATFKQDELINLSTLKPWKTIFYHLFNRSKYGIGIKSMTLISFDIRLHFTKIVIGTPSNSWTTSIPERFGFGTLIKLVNNL